MNTWLLALISAVMLIAFHLHYVPLLTFYSVIGYWRSRSIRERNSKIAFVLSLFACILIGLHPPLGIPVAFGLFIAHGLLALRRGPAP